MARHQHCNHAISCRSPARVAKELQELEQLRKDKERLEGGVEAELEGMRQQCKRELEEARVQHLANVEVRTAFVVAFTLLSSLLLSSCSCGLLARSSPSDTWSSSVKGRLTVLPACCSGQKGQGEEGRN